MHPLHSLLLAVPLAYMAPAAAPSVPQAEEVQTVFRLANTAKKSLHCAPITAGDTPSPENNAVARDLANIAGMYAFAARNYPPGKDAERINQINSLYIAAAGAYRAAYACVPDEPSAFYLQTAIELLSERALHLVSVERQDAGADTVTPVTQQLRELREELPQASICPVCKKCKRCPSAPEPPHGYRGLYAGRVHLGVGLGGGRARIGGPDGGTLGVFTFRASLGPRFTLGAKQRHILTTGLDYAFHRPFSYNGPAASDVESPALWHQAGLFLDYGIAPHRNFALHFRATLHFVVGVVTFADTSRPSDAFHAVAPGAGGALCTLGSALCLRVHGYRGVSSDRPSLLGSYDFTLNLDLFRVADNIVAPRARD